MDRRNFVMGAGALLSTSIAGCLNGDQSDDDPNDAQDQNGGPDGDENGDNGDVGNEEDGRNGDDETIESPRSVVIENLGEDTRTVQVTVYRDDPLGDDEELVSGSYDVEGESEYEMEDVTDVPGRHTIEATYDGETASEMWNVGPEVGDGAVIVEPNGEVWITQETRRDR